MKISLKLLLLTILTSGAAFAEFSDWTTDDVWNSSTDAALGAGGDGGGDGGGAPTNTSVTWGDIPVLEQDGSTGAVTFTTDSSGQFQLAAIPGSICSIPLTIIQGPVNNQNITVTRNGDTAGSCQLTAALGTPIDGEEFDNNGDSDTTNFEIYTPPTLLTQTDLPDPKWKKITYSTAGGTGTTQRRAAATSACASLGDGYALANKTDIVNKSSLSSNQQYFSLSANRSYISSDCVLNTQNAGITSNACYGSPVNSWMDVALCKKP